MLLREMGREGTVRFAYADPPYIGQAKKHYADDPRCAEVDHAELVARLVARLRCGWSRAGLMAATAEVCLMGGHVNEAEEEVRNE